MNNAYTIKIMATIAALMALGSTVANAASTTNNNFTMLSSQGEMVGGTNDVVFTWDGSLNTDPATATVNAALSSVTPFFGTLWTAYNLKIYGSGSYTLSTADSLVDGDCPLVGPGNCASGGDYTVSVGPGQIMAHMKFSWGTTQGIDVVNVWQAGDWNTLNPGTSNPIHTGPGGTYSGPSYTFVSTDWDGTGIAGGGMIDGPFKGFNANFNVNPVPVPAAAWLLGSGLLGLVGAARRKKSA